MARPERPIDPGGGPLAQFAADLRELRRTAGLPKYLQMARATGRSRTALAEAAGGDHLPTWETVEAYVTACGGNVTSWRVRWEQTRDLTRSDLPSPDLQGAPPAGPDPAKPAADGQPPQHQPLDPTGLPPRTSRRPLIAIFTASALVIAGVAAVWWSHRGQDPSGDTAVVVTVQNKVAVGPSALTEDSTPEFLTSKPVAYCRRRGCVVPGTDSLWSGALLPAICYTHGETITNANLSSAGIKDNPGAATSDGWYQVQLPSGTTGYIPEAYLAPKDRGGRGLPSCK